MRRAKILLALTLIGKAFATTSDEHAIRSLVANIERAYNNNQSILEFLTTAGDMRPFDGPVLKRTELARQPIPVYKVTPMKRTVEQIRLLRPDLALVDGRLQEIDNGGKTLNPILGRFTYVVSKQSSGWRIEASRMARSAR